MICNGTPKETISHDFTHSAKTMTFKQLSGIDGKFKWNISSYQLIRRFYGCKPAFHSHTMGYVGVSISIWNMDGYPLVVTVRYAKSHHISS